MSIRQRHLVIAVGGTGGHFFPGLAIGEEFRNQGGRVTFVVAGQRIAEHRATALASRFPAVSVAAVRLPAGPLQAAAFPFRFARGLIQGRRVMKTVAADAVLGMGSFASVPTCLAAIGARVPLFLHEGNAVIGRANRFLSRWAGAMAISLPLRADQQCRCPCELTGLPLREQILRAAALPESRAQTFGKFHLTADKPILLVFGGSLGAAHLNGVMRGAAERLGSRCAEFQLIHLTGAEDNSELEAAYTAAGLRAVVRRSEPHIEDCYLAADLVCSRAGASTIAELAMFGRPAVLVPLPTSANGHQAANAEVVASHGAARPICQSEFDPERWAETIVSWLDDASPWELYGRKIREMARPRARRAVIDLLLRPDFSNRARSRPQNGRPCSPAATAMIDDPPSDRT